MDVLKLKQIDSELSQRLPESFSRGDHLLILNAMFHYKARLNEVNAVRYILDHENAPVTVQTMLDLYGALVKGTVYEGCGFKDRNIIVSDKRKEHLFITMPADQTPAEMERVCEKYSYLGNPTPEMLGDMITFMLTVQGIHPFRDGNGRFSSLLLQLLMFKAGFRCAPLVPVDIYKYGPNMGLHSKHVVYACGAFYGEHPIVADRYIEFMCRLLDKAYICLRDTIERYEFASGIASDAR